MAHRKRNRKGGILAPRKTADFKVDRELPSEKVKKGKGKPSGSRQQAGANATTTGSHRGGRAADKRVGSKKPIKLVATGTLAKKQQAAAPKAKVAPPLSLEAQLKQLEQDPRLSELLDRSDEGDVLSPEDQQWLETRLERISELMDELGITDDDDIDEFDDDDDWDRFDSGDLDDLMQDKDS